MDLSSFATVFTQRRKTMFEQTKESGYLYSSLATEPGFDELVEMYVESIPDKINALLQSSAAREWDALATVAHQIKGSAESYGFAEITPYAADLERASKEDDSDEEAILNSMNELIEQCRRLRAGTP